MKYSALAPLLILLSMSTAQADDVVASDAAEPVSDAMKNAPEAVLEPESAPASAPDNGNDPTKFSKMMSVQWESIELHGGAGGTSDVLNLTYWQPFGHNKNSTLRIRLPVSRMTALGNDAYNIGDASLRWNHVIKMTPTHGWVSALAMTFDTAQRADLGTGKNVVMAGLTYAKFFKSGGIFAPSVQHNVSLWGDKNRADANYTIFDFYFVPKMKNPKVFVLVDPALTLDWESNKKFLSVATTFGRSIGRAFGGDAQLFIKPTFFVGADRPGKWGVEFGYKVVGF